MFNWLKNCGVRLTWISVCVLLHGRAVFPSNTFAQNQHLNVTVEEQKDTSWDSPFLQLRASLLSYSQPIRPYALLTNADDYHYIPKPKHRRPSHLHRVLGSSFDPFWMSIEQPSEISGIWVPDKGHRHGGQLPAKLPNFSASSELKEASTNLRQKLEKEAADVDLSSLPSDVSSSVRDWLVRSATCGLSYQWVDQGPAFWPRWLRQTDCVKSDGVHSCSFPSGMKCMRVQTMHIKILAWVCMESGDGVDGAKGKADRSDGTAKRETGGAMKMCFWRQVPYPVVTACQCSCK
ncbi:noggin-2-like [Genypterus blacodes]|uniref:noggin-2-like n=1 Tax=Genypterus blacodes TaxID=154954 RepID=UPI003F7689E5